MAAEKALYPRLTSTGPLKAGQQVTFEFRVALHQALQAGTEGFGELVDDALETLAPGHVVTGYCEVPVAIDEGIIVEVSGTLESVKDSAD